MTDIFWTQVRAAFDAALDAAPGARLAVLQATSGGNADVEREALALLEQEPGDFLESGAGFAIDAQLIDDTLPVGADINGYRITRMVGRGGMGEVYEALRGSTDFTKRVAIKVLRAGATGPEAVRRFERERRILAGLEHRNIAALIDGGVLTDGRPYLVMEFVEGERITDWCRSRDLSVDVRLSLFRQICGAVSYAHRNFIVHRDLKPGNILVANDGTVKLLDFGIAKVLDDDTGSGGDTVTRAGGGALTPEYAAPEQLTGGAITTATDVYALGLLLFELLTGARPFATASRTLPELTRLVLTTDPPMASAMVQTERAAGDIAGVRRTLRGDLDAILLKTLRTDPLARYGTVDALVDDLRRHERGLPVEAMRGHRGYRIDKFLRRNRVVVIAAAVIGVVMLTGAVSTWRESRRTNIQRARAETTNQFLIGMLAAVNPSAAGREVSMAEVLDSAAVKIAADTTLGPEVEASLRSAIGTSYTALGKSDAGAPHLQRALALRLAHPDDHVALAGAYRDLALLRDSRGEYGPADSLYRKGLDVLAADRDPAAIEMATDLLTQHARMQSLNGDWAGGAVILREVAARQARAHGAQSREAAIALSQLGVSLTQKHDLLAADSAERQALQIFRSLSSRPTPEIGRTQGRLATVLDQLGQRAAADSAYRESVTSLDATLGVSHPDVAWIRYNYAGFLLDGKDWRGAIAEADSVLQLRGTTIPETHTSIAGTYQLRGLSHAGLGEHAAAEQDLRESLALRRKYLPADHWLIGSSESVLGAELAQNGARLEAVQLLTDGCKVVTKALGPDNPAAKKAVARAAAAGVTCG
jgi:eukaryotic-like serine/threonine-protein kinase